MTHLLQTPLYRDKLNYYLSLMTGDEKHAPSSISTLDVLWILYDRILHISPETVESKFRDRFFLSKGHGPMALYAVLALKGFISPDILNTYGEFNSVLGYHPDRTKLSCIEISSGSLGHGLSMAIGSLLALKAQKIEGPSHWVLLGDAELDEGSNHEAIVFAGRQGLAELNVVVIDNDSSTLGWPGGIGNRFMIEGWEVSYVDGRDHEALYTAFKKKHPIKPHAIIAIVETKSGTHRRTTAGVAE
ncbi:transketolase [Serratia fonticola]|uniref:Transketolase n=1 Tax=Serratia fonticola TaxID=47917 RepID=A0A559TAD9_SERFO|nr:transketolase [Serratia fonticola]TQI80895.1 transketolase [Serratia fonticola]TQI97080.1 transketolase [Serratia fonticola]TVZ71576.1 transketolase [Serratia fonticola]